MPPGGDLGWGKRATEGSLDHSGVPLSDLPAVVYVRFSLRGHLGPENRRQACRGGGKWY